MCLLHLREEQPSLELCRGPHPVGNEATSAAVWRLAEAAPVRSRLHHWLMRHWPREIFIELDLMVRIRYCRSEHPPPIEYAVMLETLIDGEWTTIALWDNADAPDEHHEHRYTRSEGKHEPAMLDFETTNEAMAAAIRKAATDWQIILKDWNES